MITITNWQELHSIRNNLAGSYILGNSLTPNTVYYNEIINVLKWTPIGTAAAPFTGSFNGDGNTITGLKINKPLINNVGLFGVVSGSIQKVHLHDVFVVGKNNTGALCGLLNSTGVVMQSSATGSVVGAEATGGLIGQLYGSLLYAGFIGEVSNTAFDYVGGLVGRARTGATASQTYCAASVYSSGIKGALCGHEEDAETFASSYWNSDSFEALSSNGIGTPLTTLQMKDTSNSYFVGWDFDEVWSRSAEIVPQCGDFWKISEAGTIDSVAYQENDWIIYSAGWHKETNGNVLDRFLIDRKLQFTTDLAESFIVLGPENSIISIAPSDIETPPGLGIVPLFVNDLTQMRTFNDCALVPSHRLHDGDTVKIRLLDSSSVVVSELLVIAREAKAIGDFTMAEKVIIKAELIANDVTYEDGNIKLPVGTSASTLIAKLGIKLTYGDNSTENIMVDGSTCIVYGLSAIQAISTTVGVVYPFLVKLFLQNGIHSPIAAVNGSERFVAHTGGIVIVTA